MEQLKRVVKNTGLLTAFCILSYISLIGCTTSIRMPDSEEEAKIRAGQKSIVLMRIQAIFENDPVDSFSIDSENFFVMKSSSYDGDSKPGNLWPYRSPSEKALREGWIYFLLEPGSHFLYVKPPPFSVDIDRVRAYSPYWLFVPKGKKLLYAGSMTATCKSRKLFFSRNVQDCSGLHLTDESDKLDTESLKPFNAYGTAAVSLAKKYPPSEPAIIKALQEISINEQPSLGAPDWRKRGIYKTTGLGGRDDEEDKKAGIGFGAGGDPRGLAGLAMLYILYLPVGITAGSISGSVNESRWSKCISDIDAGLRSIDMQKMITDEFHQYTPASATTAMNDSRAGGILELSIRRIVIRECSVGGTFCPEISIRAIFREKIDGSPLLDAAYAYSDSHIEYETPAYQIRPAKGEACRELKDYCTSEGKALFLDEIRRGLSWITANIRHDLGLIPYQQ